MADRRSVPSWELRTAKALREEVSRSLCSGHPRRQLGAASQIEFGDDALHVGLGGAFGDPEVRRDLLVGQPVGHEAGDLELPARWTRPSVGGDAPTAQSARRAPLAEAFEEPSRIDISPYRGDGRELTLRRTGIYFREELDAPKTREGASEERLAGSIETGGRLRECLQRDVASTLPNRALASRVGPSRLGRTWLQCSARRAAIQPVIDSAWRAYGDGRRQRGDRRVLVLRQANAAIH